MTLDASGVFREWGKGLEAVYGYRAEEVIGRRPDFLIPPVLREKHWEGFNKAVATGRMKRTDGRFTSVGVHKDGHLVPTRAIDVLNFGPDGKVESVTGTVITQGPKWAGKLLGAALAPLKLMQR